MSRATAAILCIARNETPFAAEWLAYHFGLGFDHVYYVSTDPDFERVAGYLARCQEGSGDGSKLSLFHFSEFFRGWQIASYRRFLPRVREDWVLIMDLDEYLWIDGYADIQGLLEAAGDVAQVQFPWLNVMSDAYAHESTFDILGGSGTYASDHVKSIVRRTDVEGLGVHAHAVGSSRSVLSSGEEVPARARYGSLLQDPSYCQRHPFMLHFCSRGHFDVVNRIVDHRFFNDKNGPAEVARLRSFLNGTPSWENVPTRYLLLKLHRALPAVRVDLTPPRLACGTDVPHLRELFRRHVASVVDLRCAEADALATEFENRFQLAEKLTQLDLTVDLDAYRRCGSPLEYVGRVRRREAPAAQSGS